MTCFSYAARLFVDTNYFQIALYDFNDEGNFKWCKGNYSLPLKKDALLKFAKKQPDNWGAGGEQCGILAIPPTLSLHDFPCNYLSKFICEVRVKYFSWDRFIVLFKIIHN